MATGAVPVRIRTATHFSSENSHRETLHRGRAFRSPRAFVGVTAALRYEPCTQFINVSQRPLHIYFIDGCRRIKIERNNLLCEQAPTEVFRSIFAWLVTFNLQHLGSVHGQLKGCLQHFRCTLTHHHTSKEYFKILIHAADLRINLQIQ